MGSRPPGSPSITQGVSVAMTLLSRMIQERDPIVLDLFAEAEWAAAYRDAEKSLTESSDSA